MLQQLLVELDSGSVASGAPVAWFPANEALAVHPHEAIWADGPLHLQLEPR